MISWLNFYLVFWNIFDKEYGTVVVRGGARYCFFSMYRIALERSAPQDRAAAYIIVSLYLDKISETHLFFIFLSCKHEQLSKEWAHYLWFLFYICLFSVSLSCANNDPTWTVTKFLPFIKHKNSDSFSFIFERAFHLKLVKSHSGINWFK